MIRILLAVAMLAAALGSAHAKPTFNQVRAACRTDIEKFLGDTPWAGHAIRVRRITFVDFGRSLDRVIWKPVHAVYFGVETRHYQALDQTMKGAFVDDAIENITHGEHPFRPLLLEARRFSANRAHGARVWYVFRGSPDASRWGNTRLFSMDPSGLCIQTDFVASWFVPSIRHLVITQ